MSNVIPYSVQLSHSCSLGHEAVELLLGNGTDPNGGVDPIGMNTPFARAVETGNVDAATMIFESGAMVNTEHMIPILMYNPLANWTDLLRRFGVT